MSLEDLPSELIADICEIADKNVLMALRLTDKRISTSATKCLSGRFMSSFSVIMTKPCLERLIEICEHPSFGPGVRKISITCRSMSDYHIEHLEDERNRLIEEDGDQSEEIARAELMIKRCMDQYKDEEALKKDGEPTTLLTRAFAALKTWRQDVELSILPNPHMHDGAIFLDRDCFQSRDFSRTDYCLRSRFQPCLDAIRISKMNFYKLDIISSRKRSRNFGQYDFSLDSFSNDDMKRFSMLRSINIELGRRVGYTTMQVVANIVSQAHALQVLHLSHSSMFVYTEHSILLEHFELGDNALRSVSSDEIKSLSFLTVSFSKHCLLEFLRRHRDTLEALHFVACALRDGSWHEVISYMKESLPLLNTLSIESLVKFIPPTNYSEVIIGFEGTVIKGRVEVQAALQEIVDRPLDNQLLRRPQGKTMEL
jgi:hypothetical protein